MLYAIKGSEEFLHKQYMEKITDANTDIRTVSNISEDDFMWASESSLFGGRKLLVIRLDELKADEKLQEVLSEYKDMVDIVVRAYNGRDNLKIWSWLKQNAETYSAEPLDDKGFSFFLKGELQKYGVRLEEEIFGYLVERLNYPSEECDLYRTDIWVRMLSFYDSVTKEIIDAVICISGNQTGFDAVRYIGTGNRKELVNSISNKKGEAIPILSAVQWSLRAAIRLKLFKPSEIGVSPWQEKNLRELTRCRMEILDRAYIDATDGIARIKKGAPEQDILTRTCVQIMELVKCDGGA